MNPTALDILEKNGVKIFGAHQERLLAAMRDIAETAFAKGAEHGFDPERFHSTNDEDGDQNHYMDAKWLNEHFEKV